MLSFVKANGWVLVTRKMTKKGHNVREYVLSMKKIFQSTCFEMKQATCVFNLTSVGSSMCVKEHSDLFLNLMIEYAVKRANSGIYVPYRELPAWREKMIMIKPA